MSDNYRREDPHQWTDSAGFTWDVHVVWQEVDGRYEPVTVTLDSQGQKALTSYVHRQFERHLVQRRETEAQRLTALVEKAPAGAIRDRAQRQLEKWQAEQPPQGQGQRKDHQAYLERVLVLYYARRNGQDLLEALNNREAEAARRAQEEANEKARQTGKKPKKVKPWSGNQDSLNSVKRRTQDWDKEVGLNLLTASPDDVNALQRAWRLAKGLEHHTDETKGKKK